MAVFQLALVILIPLVVLRISYRLYIHPLAHVPGPKLAAITNLYSAYYIFCRRGKYTHKILELHKRYGPVIRTHPNEIHVFDRTAYDQIYRVGTEFDKCQNFYDHPLGEGSHFNMPDLKSSKLRRDMFASALSRAAVQKAEPRLRDTVLRFIQVLRRSAEMNDVVDMTAAFHSLTTDAIMHFAWGINFGAIDTKDFNFPTIERMNYFLVGAVILRTFHSIMRPFFTFAFRFPLIAKFNSTFRAAHWLRESCNRIVENSVAKSNIEDIGLFSSALKQHRESGLPNVRELTSEAIVFLVGGEESSANTLIHGTYHILSDQKILGRLLLELHQAIPQEETLPSVASLEKIPFLTAVVKESLRFSHGAPGRLPRVVPNQGALLCGYSIPKETRVSSSHYVYHMDERVFPDPGKFDPDRWLNDDVGRLDRHLLSFSRGSRGCIGINLAYAELYLTFACLFRLLDMELYETAAKDLEWGDFYAPMTIGHLKVRFRSNM